MWTTARSSGRLHTETEGGKHNTRTNKTQAQTSTLSMAWIASITSCAVESRPSSMAKPNVSVRACVRAVCMCVLAGGAHRLYVQGYSVELRAACFLLFFARGRMFVNESIPETCSRYLRSVGASTSSIASVGSCVGSSTPLHNTF
jgi:hypothetical protein